MRIVYHGEQRVPNVFLDNSDLAGLLQADKTLEIEGHKGRAIGLTLTQTLGTQGKTTSDGANGYIYNIRGQEKTLRDQRVLPVNIENEFYVYLNLEKQ